MVYLAFFLFAFVWTAPVSAKPKLAGIDAVKGYKESCPSSYELLNAAKKKQKPGYDKEARIRRGNATFDEITDKDNERFLGFAQASNRGQESPAKFFFDIENAVLKTLNDGVVKDRELVTALTNLHKDVVWAEVSKNEILAKALLGKYSDFKSLRFAFTESSRELEREAAKVLFNINKKYSEYLADLVAAKGWDARMKGLTGNVRNWYHGGVGETADQAGLAARFSREELGPDGVGILRPFRESAPHLQQAAYNAGRFQKWVGVRFADVPGFLVDATSGRKVLSAEAIEAIKKVTAREGETIEAAVSRTLSQRFRSPIGEREAKGLLGYVDLVEKFSPGLLQAKRVVIDMAEEAAGVISADFKGQNARNIEETMKALASTENQHISTRIQAVRVGEEKATVALDQKKAQFDRAMDRLGKETGVKIRAQFTGDDGVAFVPFDLAPELRARAQKILLEEMNAEDIRLAFVPFKDVPVDARSEWIVRAEGLEKKLRQELVEKIPRERLNALQIGVELKPSAGAASAEIHLGMKGGQPTQAEIDAVKDLAQKLGYPVRAMR